MMEFCRKVCHSQVEVGWAPLFVPTRIEMVGKFAHPTSLNY